MKFDHDFTLNVYLFERRFEVLGRTRKWHPLPGIDLKKYPLPSEKVTELVCPEADNLVTWGETKDKAVMNMQLGLERWLERNDVQPK